MHNEISEIVHLDFSLNCDCRIRDMVRPAKFFGLVRPQFGQYRPCGESARYAGVTLCCENQIFMCSEHRSYRHLWACKLCRKVFHTNEGMVIYSL